MYVDVKMLEILKSEHVPECAPVHIAIEYNYFWWLAISIVIKLGNLKVGPECL